MLRSARGRGKGTGSEAACFSPRRCLSPQFDHYAWANSGDRHRPTAWRSQSPAPLPPQGAGINRNAYKLLDGKGRLMSPADSRNAINSVLLGRRPQEPAGRAGLPPAYLRKNRMSRL